MGQPPQTVGHIYASKAGYRDRHKIFGSGNFHWAGWKPQGCMEGKGLFPLSSVFIPLSLPYQSTLSSAFTAVKQLLPSKVCMWDEQLLSAHVHSSGSPAQVNKHTQEMIFITFSSRLVLMSGHGPFSSKTSSTSCCGMVEEKRNKTIKSELKFFPISGLVLLVAKDTKWIRQCNYLASLTGAHRDKIHTTSQICFPTPFSILGMSRYQIWLAKTTLNQSQGQKM